MTSWSKARNVFFSNATIAGSKPTRDMGICIYIYSLCVALYVGPFLAVGRTSIQSPAGCVKDQDAETAAKAHQLALETLFIKINLSSSAQYNGTHR
jgi:hypothetical protein